MKDVKNSPNLMGLSAEKLELLGYLLEEEGIELLQKETIHPRANLKQAALSFAQQRLWFLDQLEPGNPVYNIPAVYRLRGLLNATALEESLSEILRHHEALRTTFAVVDGQPLQIVSPAQPLSLPVVDLQELPQSEREAEAQRLAVEEAQRPFDLVQGPLFRPTLLRLNEDDHILLYTMHHIISDGWSLDVFERELAALYAAFLNGQPSPLPELPIQYADYAVWQRQWLQGEVLQVQLDYWKKQLAGAPAILELPTDRPRPAAQSFRGARQDFCLPSSLVQSLKALSRQEDVTLFMTLLAAFQMLLHRYTGQDDIVIGSPMAGRTRQETEGVIGFFVNTLVFRTKLSPNMSFRELLAHVREVALGAYAHQDLPFEKLVEELHPERNLSHSPLFQVMFAPHITRQIPALLGVTVSAFPVERATAKFDLTLQIAETEEELLGSIEYNTDIFDQTTISRMQAHFQVILRAVLTDPDQPISTLPLLTETERHQILLEWNGTATEYPTNLCIHQLFETQVEKTPDAVAVIFENRQLIYRELNRRANQLAHHLQSLGVGPDVLVGLYMERSVEMIVAVLAILKAGGAYLPIDPDYPRERIARMLEDSRTPLVLTLGQNIEGLAEVRATIVSLDKEIVAKANGDNLRSWAAPENLAYVIYTSGSTGKPKGVAMPHGALCNLITWQRQNSKSGCRDKTLQFTSLSFDVSFQEIFSTFSSGGTLVLLSEDLRRDALNLSHFLSEKRVQRLFLPFVALNHLAEVANAKEPLPMSLQEVITAGEQLQITSAISSWFANLEGCSLYNQYGPSETHVVTAFTLEGSPTVWTLLPPIGRPIANTQIYLLDSHLNLLPIGVAGELYIGGDGLARGYLNRPDLTAERFIPNPFSDKPGARMYNTGDLARYLPDGNIEFLGRIDNQVKIRGFRIELGEIEVVLGQHPAVRETVVLARDEVENPKSEIQNPKLGGKRLIAYVIAEPGQAPTINELRSFLKQKLPDYMVPSAFVMLDALPLSPNGKVDRRALPAPDQRRPELQGAFVPPRTPIEEVLTETWSDVLGVEQVGIHDNFFELGGHSLLAIQVVSRLRTALRVEIPLRSLFQTPTVAGLAESIDTARREEKGLQIPPIVPVARDGLLPLSFSQQRLWFLDQLEPGSIAHNMSRGVRLTGMLNVAALEQSLNEIIRRHEVLRTTFTTLDGKPFQVIAPAEPLTLRVIDLRELPKTEREAEALRLANEEAHKPFDLAQGPLFRAWLIRLEEENHIFFYSIHHIASDGWSLGLFVEELWVLYKAFSAGQPSPLPELPIQYADYAVWQRQWLQGEVLQVQLDYWKKQLAGAPAILELPTDRPRPAAQSFRGARQDFRLPSSLVQSLKALSRQEDVTLFMTLLAAFQTLLHRYTGQDDIVVGSPIANRTRSEIEHLIGLFVNMLPLRTDLSGNPSFRKLLGRLREAALEAYGHQDLPFEKLVEELQPERNLSHNPIFQVMFAVQNTPLSHTTTATLTKSNLGLETQATRFDLEVHIWEKAEGLVASFIYNTDLFEAATIARMIGHFQVLLEAVIADPDQQILDVPLLTEPERNQALALWNNTSTGFSKQRCIHELFEEQVERTPEAIAVVFEEKQLTYRELNSRANQLAHYLKRRGVGPEVRVGICVERSLEIVLGLLGILKAGGAYVPLDPNYPNERLAFMLEDARVPILLTTQQRLVEGLPENGATVVCLDSGWEAIAQESEESPCSGVSAENLAYVIYTSGSTGRPKGVQIFHRAVVNLLESMRRNPGLTEDDRLLTVTTLSFDIAGLELYLPLIVGAWLIVVSRAASSDGSRLADLLEQSGATVMQATPATWRLLLGADWQGSDRLKILCGGEALSRELANQLLKRSTSLWNMYGPTETTIWSAVYRVESEAGPVSIGRPIANTQLYMVDRRFNLVPIGVAGELYIGGAGLARGYLNRADLTAEKFTPNPFSEESGARLYKTGDLARYLPDGNIEFLGRIDNQVKIRGFRIELGEIEAVLGQHPAVRETVVIAREGEPGDKRLIAYVIAEPGQAPTINELRSFLKEKLPEYMVPSAFVMLDTLPLSPNGKVDRRALPAPDQRRPEIQGAFVPPRTPIEEVLTEIWSDVLGVEQVGIHDNFFELGGHSLLATQVVSRLRTALRVEIPLRSLFQTPTVAGLAESIDTARREEKGLQIPPIVPVARDGLLPLSFSQQRLWFLDQLEPGSAVYNVPSAVRLTGMLNVAALEQSLNEIIRRHEVLRTTFTTLDGKPFQVIAPAEPLTLRVIDLGELPKTEREAEALRLVNEEAHQAFDLAKDSLLRVALLQLGPGDHVLICVMHHIVCDAWSLGVFKRELWTLYQSFSAGKPSPLPELPIQYADYAVWQRQWLQGDVLETQLSYWRKQLEGIPTLQLPTDHPRPAVQTFRGARHSLMLPKDLSDALKALSRQQGVTLFMSLLAAFQTLLWWHTDQDDIVVGADVANRNRTETERLIGLFVNQLVLRSTMHVHSSFLELLSEVRAMTEEVYDHQDLPFDRLVEFLNPQRDLSRNPIFQVIFIFENTPIPVHQPTGLILKPLQIDIKTAPFDVSLQIRDLPEGLLCRFRYNADLFYDATIKSMALQFQNLLSSVARQPNAKLDELAKTLVEAELQRRVLEERELKTNRSKKFKTVKRKPVPESHLRR